MIIVIEGTDGSGKQTQTELLYKFLKSLNKKVIKQSFPNYESKSSELVKQYLNGEFGDLKALTPFQASVFFSVDRFLTMQKYKEFLLEGGILLLDRYVSSNIIHQASKIEDGFVRKKFIKELEHFEYDNLNLPKADLTIFLDLCPKLSKKLRDERNELKSGTKKDIHEANFDYLKNCYKIGKQVAKTKNWEIIKCFEKDRVLDIQEIQNKIQSVVKNYLI